ncbi:hypothetical protein ACP4J4_00575 [Aureimonas ureilytica]|uniref:hypothetical protein n=1 Tax=Aureimonas ureilytica TaxID=401562 RepID=UPI003CEAC067
MPREPVLVFADGTLLDQAVGNVVANAVKHGEPIATIALSCRAEEGGVTILVPRARPRSEEPLLTSGDVEVDLTAHVVRKGAAELRPT